MINIWRLSVIDVFVSSAVCSPGWQAAGGAVADLEERLLWRWRGENRPFPPGVKTLHEGC